MANKLPLKLDVDNFSPDSEKTKYETIHTYSPGYKKVNHMLKWLPEFYQLMEPLGSVVDLGAGNGLAAEAMVKNGLSVYALEIAENAGVFELAKKYPALIAIQHCLWEPWPIQADWFVTTDVMEHIPPEHIGKTLDLMQVNIRYGGFFQACTHIDSSGKNIIGRPLHLTLKTKEWWEGELLKRWPNVRFLSGGDKVQPHWWVTNG